MSRFGGLGLTLLFIGAVSYWVGPQLFSSSTKPLHTFGLIGMACGGLGLLLALIGTFSENNPSMRYKGTPPHDPYYDEYR